MRITIQRTGSFSPKMGNGEIVIDYNMPTPYQIEEATGDHIATKLWQMCVTGIKGLEDQDGKALTKDDVLAHGPWAIIDETAMDILRKSRLTEAEKNV